MNDEIMNGLMIKWWNVLSNYYEKTKNKCRMEAQIRKRNDHEMVCMADVQINSTWTRIFKKWLLYTNHKCLEK